jgi:lipoate-protein ligase B
LPDPNLTVNVNPDLAYFDGIMPGGIEDCQITSLYEVLDRPLEISDVIEPVIRSFYEVFGGIHLESYRWNNR